MPENISSDTSDIVPAAYSDNYDYSCAICTRVCKHQCANSCLNLVAHLNLLSRSNTDLPLCFLFKKTKTLQPIAPLYMP